jgi:hypothetical protein
MLIIANYEYNLFSLNIMAICHAADIRRHNAKRRDYSRRFAPA